jgi:hypothetical protein
LESVFYFAFTIYKEGGYWTRVGLYLVQLFIG